MFLVFSNFSYSFFLKLLSSGVAIFITSASFWFFPTVNIIGWLVRNCLSYWNLRWSWRYYSPWFSGNLPSCPGLNYMYLVDISANLAWRFHGESKFILLRHDIFLLDRFSTFASGISAAHPLVPPYWFLDASGFVQNARFLFAWYAVFRW